MRVLAWAVAAGLALGAVLGWWSLQRERSAADPAVGSGTEAPAEAPADAETRPGPPLYRWRDEAGTLHITDQPPADRPYEVVKLRDDQNVVSLRGPAPEPEPGTVPAD